VGGPFGTLKRREECVQGFGGQARRKENTWKITAWMGRWDQNGSWADWLGGVDWIQLAQDRDQWRSPVNTVMPAGVWR
jgi:hypothetical protein